MTANRTLLLMGASLATTRTAQAEHGKHETH
jgi:hypothetical protein